MNGSASLSIRRRRVAGAAVCILAILIPVLAGYADAVLATAAFVFDALIDVAALIVPGIVLAAWITASGAGNHVAAVFDGQPLRAILAASFIGALTPVCGVTVLPLMVGLLSAGVPLAPVMAFWLSSPITDPAMLAATAATLGPAFAVGKTLIAFLLGTAGGIATQALAATAWTQPALHDNSLVRGLGARDSTCVSTTFDAAIWRTAERRRAFQQETFAITRLILICLTPAFAAEYWLNELLEPDALSAYLGAESWMAIPLTVVVGAPAYLDGYAALPLVRGLMDHGMSPGAAMAFLISGGVVSIWGAMAIFPVLRLKPFLLYLALAVAGSMAAGYGFDLFF